MDGRTVARRGQCRAMAVRAREPRQAGYRAPERLCPRGPGMELSGDGRRTLLRVILVASCQTNDVAGRLAELLRSCVSRAAPSRGGRSAFASDGQRLAIPLWRAADG